MRTTKSQVQYIKHIVTQPPQKSGIDAPYWSPGLARAYIKDILNVDIKNICGFLAYHKITYYSRNFVKFKISYDELHTAALNGISRAKIGKQHGLSRGTIDKLYRNHKVEYSLTSSRLTPKQSVRFYTIASSPPTASKIDAPYWTGKLLARYVQDAFGIFYTEDGIYRVIQRLHIPIYNKNTYLMKLTDRIKPLRKDGYSYRRIAKKLKVDKATVAKLIRGEFS